MTDENPRRTFLERMAGRLGVNARSTAVFGDPVERDGVTVIPVAKVRWGFGGGRGRQTGDRKGIGGGGGVRVAPLGYIEIKEGNSQYRPIRDPAAYVPLVVAGGLVGCLLLRAVKRLVR